MALIIGTPHLELLFCSYTLLEVMLTPPLQMPELMVLLSALLFQSSAVELFVGDGEGLLMLFWTLQAPPGQQAEANL